MKKRKSIVFLSVAIALSFVVASIAAQSGGGSALPKGAFRVDKVKLAKHLLLTESATEAIERKFGQVVGYSQFSKPFVIMERPEFVVYVADKGGANRLPFDSFFKPTKDYHDNSLISAVHFAHAQHRPLILSPDMIWLTLAQGFILHLHNNPKILQRYLGAKKKLISIIRRDIDAANLTKVNWGSVMKELSVAVVKRTPKKINNLLLTRFSTTRITEQIAYRINLLHAYKNQYNYEVYAICGIPWIQLEGSVADWVRILQLFKRFRAYGLKQWVDAAVPILKQFVAASKGKPDMKFWCSIYKNKVAYAWTYCNGWIGKLFPYLVQYEKTRRKYSDNKKWQENKQSYRSNMFDQNIELPMFPNGLSVAPFTLRFSGGSSLSMQAVSGIIGFSQDARSKALRPEIGWLVRRVR